MHKFIHNRIYTWHSYSPVIFNWNQKIFTKILHENIFRLSISQLLTPIPEVKDELSRFANQIMETYYNQALYKPILVIHKNIFHKKGKNFKQINRQQNIYWAHYLSSHSNKVKNVPKSSAVNHFNLSNHNLLGPILINKSDLLQFINQMT